MKKFIAILILTILCCTALASCGDGDSTTVESSTDATMPRLITDNG